MEYIVGLVLFFLLVSFILWVSDKTKAEEQGLQATRELADSELRIESRTAPRKHRFTIHVAGVSYRRSEVERCYPGQEVDLIRAPENPHDANAIEVWADDHIGFIPRHEAENMAPMMDSGDWVHEAYIDSLFGRGGVRLRVTYYRSSR